MSSKGSKLRKPPGRRKRRQRPRGRLRRRGTKTKLKKLT
jgi:hypothetical protein